MSDQPDSQQASPIERAGTKDGLSDKNLGQRQLL
jgi:hypothetical protein